MKIYRNVIVSAKSLRTGLFVVCFFAVVCLAAGCGKTDALLSELRGEDTVSTESGSGSEQSGDANEESGAVIEKNTAGFSEKADIQANSEASRQSEKIYVHVCGAVKSPGVYELSAESRFYEAVEAAGGFAEEACEDYLNMAALLADGSRLEIPTQEEIREREQSEKADGKAETGSGEKQTEYHYYTLTEAKGKDSDSESSADASGELVNINTADAEGLCRLPGIGEGRAKAIIEYRQKQGRFQKKEDIMKVSGIGEKMYARMEEYLTVE